jgi:prepilin-type N-terminal cleavage/methylation domain-containing protein
MNLKRHTRKSSGSVTVAQSGMTLPEIMVTSAVFSIALAGFVALNLFAMRMNERTKAKLGASDDARLSVSRMIMEIRMAGLVRIGNGNETSFTEVGPGMPQEGNAIQIFPLKGDATNYVRYFRDDFDSKLKRTDDGGTTSTVVAHAITNQIVFCSEGYNGQVLSNNFNNRVVGVTLQFKQLEYLSASTGQDRLGDYYQLRTKITRRALE